MNNTEKNNLQEQIKMLKEQAIKVDKILDLIQKTYISTVIMSDRVKKLENQK